MKQHYSIFTLARNATSYHEKWTEAWRSPDPKPEYDVIIVGGGGHGLATAYYLAKEHGLTNIAVLEKGWLGGGNTGRNTTIVRSNYLWDESAAIYEHALRLFETLSEELNLNVMLSQRGVLNLAHTPGDVREAIRRVRLPLQSHPLQALVSEPVKPVHNCVVMSNAVHVYVSQSDKGELVMGAGIDGFNSYAQRGSFHVIEHQMAAVLELFPIFSRLRMMRTWGGIV